MRARSIKDDVFWVGAVDWDRRLFDGLLPLPDGTSYNAYLIRGSDKTALIDTVDPAMSSVLLSRLGERNVEHLHYVVANHAEQDHSGTLPQLLARFPDAQIVCTASGKKMLLDLLPIEDDRFVTVVDGARLSLGGKTLQFLHTPWVHWPETMSTYLPEDRILFSCDFFGSHLATSRLFSGEDERVHDAAKRYYAATMMPFRAAIRKNLEKVAPLAVDFIAPSHGPVRDDPERIFEAYRDWVSDQVSNSVVLPYVSMHGSTEAMVDYLVDALVAQGITVECFNLTATDWGKLAAALVDAATLVVGSPTVLSGAHPMVAAAVFMANALRPKVRFASFVGSYGWGGKMVEQLSAMVSNLKVEMLPPVIARGYPKGDDFAALDELARAISTRHVEVTSPLAVLATSLPAATGAMP